MRERTAAEREMERSRLERLRADARRPISVNLAETIRLSDSLIRLARTSGLR